MQMTEALFVKFQKKVWEALKDSIKTFMGYFEVGICGFELAKTEESTVMSKRPAPMK